METILIKAQNDAEVQLIRGFLQQNKLHGRLLSDEDKEDFVLSRLMDETNESDVIDTSAFLQKLRS